MASAYSSSHPKSREEWKFESSANKNVTRCIDISSTFRDRQSYPNASDFIVPFNMGGRKTSLFTSFDPVSEGYPYETGVTSGATGTATEIYLSTGSYQDNFYINDYLQLTIGGSNQYRQVESYNATSLIVTVTSPFTLVSPEAGTVNLPYEFRQDRPMFEGTILAGSTSSSLVLSGGDLSTFVGQFIRITSGANDGTVATIRSYTGSTVFITPTLTVAPAPGDTFEILAFSYDTVQPLIYSGTDVFSQPVAYKVKLEWVSIPYQLLNVGYGGFINSYPFIYVGIGSAQAKSSEQTLYSNNPNSKDYNFKVPVDISELSQGVNFVTCYSDSEQIITFKPNDSLRLRVALPNGELISFAISEDFSPAPPNPLIQINYLFSITRM